MFGGFPEVPPVDGRLRSDGKPINDGRFAEYFVAADLERRHFACTVIDGREYDLIAETAEGVILVQVKSTLAPTLFEHYRGGRKYKYKKYAFQARGCNGGFGSYSLVDICAFVALDKEAIVYRKIENVLKGGMMTFFPKQFIEEAKIAVFPYDTRVDWTDDEGV